MKEMVPESTSRHVTRPMPRLTRYWTKQSSVLARFLKFQQVTENRGFHQIQKFFHSYTPENKHIHLGE